MDLVVKQGLWEVRMKNIRKGNSKAFLIAPHIETRMAIVSSIYSNYTRKKKART